MLLGSIMLSDDSSSDSETGRFKCRTKKPDEQSSTSKRQDSFRSTARSGRPSENDRFRREFDRKRDDVDRHDMRSRERPRFSRHSPIRRRHSRDRSPRRSRERERHRHSGDHRARSKPREHRSASKDRRRHSRSRSRKSLEPRRDVKEDPKPVKIETKHNIQSSEKSTTKFDRRSKDKSSSPEYREKRSVITKPVLIEPPKKRSESPIIVEHGDTDPEEVQPGSYYSMIPAVVKEKSEESSEIDSSDDERLRAKLLNLEKELHKTRKKKHRRKHKRKSSKSKERDRDQSTVEVSSTTDIDKIKEDVSNTPLEVAEVTSTQKSNVKESSEEGEISSDDSQEQLDIDPTDLRHKLKRSVLKTDKIKEQDNSKVDICGPALPPHLEKKFRRSLSQDIEGPALPPILQKKSKNIGMNLTLSNVSI